jgi:diguanylate cyclase (GGDEF)-like protein
MAQISTDTSQVLIKAADAFVMGPLESNVACHGRAARCAALGTALAVLLAAATHGFSHGPLFFAGAGAGAGVAAAATLVAAARTADRRRAGFLLGALIGLPALTLMQAHAGGVASGYAVLTIVATVWLGLDAGDREHLAALLVLSACCCLPMLLVGPPAYPVSWGSAGLLIAIGATVTGTLRALRREAQALTRRLEQEAMIDDLSGLLNRRGWRYTAPRELARVSRSAHPIVLLTLDLDELKRLNDRLGHRQGDRVLRDTAVRLKATLRAGDVIARVGGDEFLALLTDANLAGTLSAIERLREITPPEGSFSAGVAVWDGREALDELVNRSDRALYAAKAGGGGRTEVGTQRLITPHSAPAGASANTDRSDSSRQAQTIAPPAPV